MICKTCNAEISDTSKFCSECGTKIDIEFDEAQQEFEKKCEEILACDDNEPELKEILLDEIGEENFNEWCDRRNKMQVDSFRSAAEQGDIDALVGLGDCYYNGIGVEKDKDEALRLYREAESKGCGYVTEKIQHFVWG